MVPKLPVHAAALLLVLSTLTSALPQSMPSNPIRRSKPCRLLAEAGLGAQLFFREDAGYAETIESYYAGDSWDLKPQCILKPETAEQVSTAIKTLNSPEVGRCWYAAFRAGGHSNFPASNTDSGVTIDLVKLNTLNLNEDGSISVGSGNRWGDIYRYLEPQGLMVAGGRENTVGVSGLLLGGGFSWYSGNVGFAADNVVSYEVILANGTLITATSTTNADLFKALKGGACNFALVTRFTLKTFPSQNLYGGVMAFDYTQAHAVVSKFTAMVDGNSAGAADDTGFVSASWNPTSGRKVAFVLANMAGHANTSAFAGLEALSPLADMRTLQPVTGIAAQIASTKGDYQVWTTLTYHNTLDMARHVLTSFEELVEDFKSEMDDSEAVRIIYLMTPFPTIFSSYGDNVFGLEETHTKNSVVFSIQAILPTPKYRDVLRQKIGKTTADIEDYARKTGQDVPFRYLNYAGPDQNPLATFGEDNVRFMKEVAAKYDPQEFFQYGVPGGFKLKDL